MSPLVRCALCLPYVHPSSLTTVLMGDTEVLLSEPSDRGIWNSTMRLAQKFSSRWECPMALLTSALLLTDMPFTLLTGPFLLSTEDKFGHNKLLMVRPASSHVHFALLMDCGHLLMIYLRILGHSSYSACNCPMSSVNPLYRLCSGILAAGCYHSEH